MASTVTTVTMLRTAHTFAVPLHRMRSAFIFILVVLPFLEGKAQLNNWDPAWDPTDSALIFHDDLDFYLNAYSRSELKGMRKQVNLWRMNFDKMMKRTIKEVRTYSEGHGMDPHTHDFTLPLANDSGTYSLGENEGKIRAFMFGSITNPPARTQMARWSRLAEKYAKEDVQLFVIYDRELHPADRKHFKAYPPPKTIEEKMAYAKEFSALGTLPVLVDGMDDAVYTLYGRAPNGAYLVDRDGNLVFRGTWADDRKMEHMIDTLLRWYKTGKPKNYGVEGSGG